MPAVAATHQGCFIIGASDPIDRIYSGHGETVLLTVQCPSIVGGNGSGTMHVLVNGSPIPNGSIVNTGVETRTFLLHGVKIIDLEWDSGSELSGQHTISVFL